MPPAPGRSNLTIWFARRGHRAGRSHRSVARIAIRGRRRTRTPRHVHGRGEPDVPGGQGSARPPAAPGPRRSRGGRADIGSFGRGLGDRDSAAVADRVLLDHDGVGAGGKGGAGEDPDALARADGAVGNWPRPAPGRSRAGNRTGGRHVGAAHGHSRPSPETAARAGSAGRARPPQDPAQRLGDRHGFRRQRPERIQDPFAAPSSTEIIKGPHKVPDLPPVLVDQAGCRSRACRGRPLAHVVDGQRGGSQTAVSASISTPVRPARRNRRRMSTASAVRFGREVDRDPRRASADGRAGSDRRSSWRP